MPTSVINRSLELADEIEEFPLGKCGPSDDPDKQTIYIYHFKQIVKRFLASARRIDHPDLQEAIEKIDSNPESISEAYDLQADLFGVIDLLREITSDPEWEESTTVRVDFVDKQFMKQLEEP